MLLPPSRRAKPPAAGHRRGSVPRRRSQLSYLPRAGFGYTS